MDCVWIESQEIDETRFVAANHGYFLSNMDTKTTNSISQNEHV